ncbi:MAG: hypothetical protein AAGA33_01945 [Pseudomonadota bacterium]
MTPTHLVLRTTLLVAAMCLASGCSAVQWNDAGRQIGASAAEQIFSVAFGGNDSFDRLTDDHLERERLDSERFDSMTREAILESDRTAERWERYDDIVARQALTVGD